MLVSLSHARHEAPPLDQDAVRKAAFAERLKSAMGHKGWGLSETARRASQLLGPDAKFGRAHVWHYLHGKAMPRDRQLRALAYALDVDPEQLLGSPSAHDDRTAATRLGTVRAHDQGDGTVFLDVVQLVRWETALAVLKVLHAPSESDRPLR